MALIRRLVERVKRCAARRPLLVCTDGFGVLHPSHSGDLSRSHTHGQRWATAAAPLAQRPDRPRGQALRAAPCRRDRPPHCRHRPPPPRRSSSPRSPIASVIRNTYIGRLHGTFQAPLPPLARGGRGLARPSLSLRAGLLWVGSVFLYAPRECLYPTQQTQPAVAAWLSRYPLSFHCLLCLLVPPLGYPPPTWVAAPPLYAFVRVGGGATTSCCGTILLPVPQSTSHILNCKLPVELSTQPQPLQDSFLPS